MTAFMPGDLLRVSCRLRAASGDDIVNVYHFFCLFEESVIEETVLTAITAYMDDLYGYIQPSIPSDVSFVDIDIQNISNEEVFPARDWDSLTVGGGTGDTMPEQCCGLVVGRTNASHVVGRKFLGPFIEAANLDGQWYSTLVTMLSDFLDKYLTELYIEAGSYLVPVVVKYLLGAPVSSEALTEGYTSGGIYTQRRRRRGVGA